jgi:curved DNA-binding protein CbpA
VARLAPAEIRALASLLDELDYYQILEIPRDAPSSAVKRAYYAVSRRLHPDANRDLEAGLRLELEGIARRVSEAYSVLRDGRRRKAYDEKLHGDGGTRLQLAQAEAAAGRKAVEDHLGRTPNGRRFFTLARADIDRGDLPAAARNLQTALTFEPGNDAFKKKLSEVREQLRG